MQTLQLQEAPPLEPEWQAAPKEDRLKIVGRSGRGQTSIGSTAHNPGVSSNGLFWTMPIQEDTVSLDFDAGTASFCLTEALMPDLHDLLTALWGGGAVDGEGMPLGRVFSSTVSAQAVWFNAGSIQQTQDPINQFVYINKQSNASIQWKSVRRGARFESDDGPQQVLFAAIGKERNGVFFWLACITRRAVRPTAIGGRSGRPRTVPNHPESTAEVVCRASFGVPLKSDRRATGRQARSA